METQETQPKRRGGPKNGPHKTMERREKVARIIEDVGLYNINISELMRIFNTDRNTIKKDISWIIDNIKITDQKEVKFEISRGYRKVLKDSMNHMSNPNLSHSERARWAEIYLRAISDVNKFIDNYGDKVIVGDLFQEVILDELKGQPAILRRIALRLGDGGL